MGSHNLKNLMLWHRMARLIAADGSLSPNHMSCYDVPVMQIVAEFRSMGVGVRGRNAHRPFPLPTYDYEAGRTKEAKALMEQAKSNKSSIRLVEGGGTAGGAAAGVVAGGAAAGVL